MDERTDGMTSKWYVEGLFGNKRNAHSQVCLSGNGMNYVSKSRLACTARSPRMEHFKTHISRATRNKLRYALSALRGDYRIYIFYFLLSVKDVLTCLETPLEERF